MMLSSCQSDRLELWIAKEKVEVYESPETNKLAFTIDIGEVCVTGQDTIRKDYQYTEILCKQGYGWITSSERLFDIITRPKK